MNVNKTIFLKMKVLAFFILPVLSSTQSNHRQDRVYLHVNKQEPYGIQRSQEFHNESDSLITQGLADDRGTQFEAYPINNRNSFHNQRSTINNNRSRINENLSPRNRTQPNERSANEDNEDLTEEDISLEDRGIIKTNRRINHEEPNTRTNQGSSREQASIRAINAKSDQHNIVFVDTELDAYTNKPNTNRDGNTQDNEISRPVTDEDSTRRTTTVMPSVDDRAAFLGDQCPDGKVRFNGVCVEIDSDR